MTLVIIILILSILFVLVAWLLLSGLSLEIDTRIPQASFRWYSVGTARVWFEEEWWLNYQVLFFRKKIRLSQLGSGKKKKPKKTVTTRKKKSGKRLKRLSKILKVLRSFTVEEWKLALDTDDYTVNARLYPLNFLPVARQHVLVNFSGENYFFVRISNRPWKILYAFLK